VRVTFQPVDKCKPIFRKNFLRNENLFERTRTGRDINVVQVRGRIERAVETYRIRFVAHKHVEINDRKLCKYSCTPTVYKRLFAATVIIYWCTHTHTCLYTDDGEGAGPIKISSALF